MRAMSAKHLLAILPGDGIGPEVIAQATRVLEFYRDKRGLPLDLWHLDLGADRYLRDRTTYPKEVADRIAHEASAVLSATGYASTSGKVGVATVTHGPAFSNTIMLSLRTRSRLVQPMQPCECLER